MRVETYVNLRLSALYEGYRPGDPLELSYEADRPDLDGAEPEDVAEALFGELNDEQRPNPAFPSLSVGGVVRYRTGSGEAGTLAVEPMGWRRVAPVPAPTHEDREAYRRKVETWCPPEDVGGGDVVHDEPYDAGKRLQGGDGGKR